MKKKSRSKRPDWNTYFLELAHLVSKRSTCLRRRVGAVIVKDRHILSTGYNGPPKGITHCEAAGCLRERLKIPSGERHELCLPPNEEIFTSEGYIPIHKVKLGQRVLTHRGLYREVTQVFKREYKSVLYHVEPWNLLPVALTPNHPVLVAKAVKCQFDSRTLCKETCKSANNLYCKKPYLNYKLEWIPASQLDKKDIVCLLFDNRSYSLEEIDFTFAVDASLDYYKVLEERDWGGSHRAIKNRLNISPSTAYNWVNGGVPRGCIAVYNGELKHGSSPSKAIPGKIKLTKEFLRLVGFYLAEGCTSLNQVSFSFNARELEFIDEIRTTMKKIFGLNCYEDKKKKNCHKLVYSSIILAKVFKSLFGEDAYTKRLPQILMRLSPEEQKAILTAYAQGDGYKMDEHTTTVTTASRDLALQTMQILLRIGYIPMIDKGRNAYRLIWKDRFKISYGYLKNNIFFSPIRKIEVKEYSGYVYNLEVEKDHSYITKSFIVHNCRGLHAEQNAIIQAALYGVSLDKATLYCSNLPCSICAKMIINAGIKNIISARSYPDKMAEEFFKEAKIRVEFQSKMSTSLTEPKRRRK